MNLLLREEPMNMQELVTEILDQGIEIRGENEYQNVRLIPRNGPDIPKWVVERVLANKPALLVALREMDCAYSELTQDAFRRIAEVCPPGALRWAREAHPALTDHIDVELFQRLNDLWNNHAPLEEFEAALSELVEVHRRVGSLFAGVQR
jgi:hypothetical protein